MKWNLKMHVKLYSIFWYVFVTIMIHYIHWIRIILIKNYDIIKSLFLMLLHMKITSCFKNCVKGLNFRASDNWITSYTSLLWTKVESKNVILSIFSTLLKTQKLFLPILVTISQFNCLVSLVRVVNYLISIQFATY